MTTNQKWIEILRHMLGAGPHIAKSKHGYRNYYCASIGDDDHKNLLEMAQSGLVKPGRIINNGSDQYFYATVSGCEEIGLRKAAINRACGL